MRTLSRLMLVILSLLCVGCTIEQNPVVDPESPEGQRLVYVLDGHKSTIADLPGEADYRIRNTLLDLRRAKIYNWTIDTAFAEQGLTVDEAFAAHNLKYMEHVSGGKEAFDANFAEGSPYPRAAFEADLARQNRLLALLAVREPLTPEGRLEIWNRQTPADWFARSGELLGLSGVAEVTPDSLGLEIDRQHYESLLNTSVVAFLDELQADYLASGRLEIVRLNAEPAGPAAADAEGEPVETPETLEFIAQLATSLEGGGKSPEEPSAAPREELVADPVAFYGDGAPIYWSQVILDPRWAQQLHQVKQQAIQIAVQTVLFDEYDEQEIDQSIIDKRVERQSRQFGGRDVFAKQLEADGFTYEVVRRSLANDMKLEHIVAKVYPITEDDIDAKYASQTPEQWFMQFREELGLRTARQATRDNLREILLDQLLGERNQEHGPAVLQRAVDRLVEIGRLQIPGRELPPAMLPLQGLAKIRSSETKTVAEALDPSAAHEARPAPAHESAAVEAPAHDDGDGH